jgi:hypothetical protein
MCGAIDGVSARNVSPGSARRRRSPRPLRGGTGGQKPNGSGRGGSASRERRRKWDADADRSDDQVDAGDSHGRQAGKADTLTAVPSGGVVRTTLLRYVIVHG